MKLWKGNVFTPVCDSVHGGGVHPKQTPPRQTPLGRHHPGRHPPPSRHPLCRHPLGRHLLRQTPPPPPTRQTPPRRPMQRTVRILLECILVFLLCCLYFDKLLNGTCPCLNVKVQSFSDYVFAHGLKIRS